MKKETLEEVITETLSMLNVDPSINIQEASDGVLISISGSDLNHLIGYRGDTLRALQHFFNSAYYNKAGEFLRITVDINGYRDQRRSRIEEMAKSFIDRVRFFAKEVEMPPMSPDERRMVHLFVSGYDDVASESVGEGRSRRVVLKPNKIN